MPVTIEDLLHSFMYFEPVIRGFILFALGVAYGSIPFHLRRAIVVWEDRHKDDYPKNEDKRTILYGLYGLSVVVCWIVPAIFAWAMMKGL